MYFFNQRQTIGSPEEIQQELKDYNEDTRRIIEEKMATKGPQLAETLREQGYNEEEIKARLTEVKKNMELKATEMLKHELVKAAKEYVKTAAEASSNASTFSSTSR